MFGNGRNRSALYRRYKRVLSTLNNLREKGILKKNELQDLRDRATQAYQEWCAELAGENPQPPRKRGRPMAPDDRRRFTKCKREGCGNAPAPGQAYCCPQCAPYAFYGIQRRNPAKVESTPKEAKLAAQETISRPGMQFSFGF